MQDPPGQGPVQPAVGDPASAGGLDQMIYRGPCQSRTFCDSVQISLHIKCEDFILKINGQVLRYYVFCHLQGGDAMSLLLTYMSCMWSANLKV